MPLQSYNESGTAGVVSCRGFVASDKILVGLAAATSCHSCDFKFTPGEYRSRDPGSCSRIKACSAGFGFPAWILFQVILDIVAN